MKLFARDALLPSGWVRDVVIGIGNDGVIESVDVAFAEPTDAERVQGPLLPGMPNAHSHAFQRALAGLTERGGPAHDDFWSWRTAMYRFLQHIGPDEHEAISSQVYLEMLRAGYTSVAEFHYLHHDPAGHPYANRGEMAERTIAAAEGSGIGLALLPVVYAHAGFGGMPPTPAQQRFVQDMDGFTAIVGMVADNLNGSITIGVAPHSPRAITPPEPTALPAFADHGLHGSARC